jgi:S1-C subfamily serine protease
MGNVFLGTIPDYAADAVKGVRISGTIAGGPAAKAGLEGGDVIVVLGGASLENIYDYMNAMNGLKVDEEIDVVVERSGRRLTLKLTPTIRE